MDNLENSLNDFSHVDKILNHLKSWWTDLKPDQRPVEDSHVVDMPSLDSTGREAEWSRKCCEGNNRSKTPLFINNLSSPETSQGWGRTIATKA